jgi:hypothetical protein
VLIELALLAMAGLVVGDSLRSRAASPRQVARRRLRRGPASAPVGGPVRVTGTVTSVPAPLRAPLSDRSCALYCAWVDVTVRHATTAPGTPLGLGALGRSFGHRKLEGTHGFTAFECRVTEFVLSTDEGTVRVIGDRAELAFAIPRARRWPKEREDAFTYQWRVGAARRTRRLRELAIVPGDRISVYGVLSEEPLTNLDERSYREASVGRCLRGSAEVPLTIGPA